MARPGGCDALARNRAPARQFPDDSERGVPTEHWTQAWDYDELVHRVRGVDNGLGNLYEVDLASVLPPPPTSP